MDMKDFLALSKEQQIELMRGKDVFQIDITSCLEQSLTSLFSDVKDGNKFLSGARISYVPEYPEHEIYTITVKKTN